MKRTKMILIAILGIAAILFAAESCLSSGPSSADSIGIKYLKSMRNQDSIAWLYAHGYFQRLKGAIPYNEFAITAEIDRSITAELSYPELVCILLHVKNAFRLSGINFSFYIDDTLLSVGTLNNPDDVRSALAKTRQHKDMIHIIVADACTGKNFGWTQFKSDVLTPSPRDLDMVGSYIFYENIKEYADVKDITFDYTDTIVTTGELMTKVIIHEIGHNLCLADNPGERFPDSFYSVMNQGYRITLVNGPNNLGPEFSDRDRKCIDLHMILGIDRTMKYCKKGCNPQDEEVVNAGQKYKSEIIP